MTSSRQLRIRNNAHKFIVREGQTAVLRRSSGERGCLVMETQFSPRDIDGQRIQLMDRRFIMSPLFPTDSDELIELSPPPDSTEDYLVLADPTDDSNTINLRLASPAGRKAPGGFVIYYELHCRNL